MRVQLSEKSKAEFIELIAKDSITCWFEGDEFVMPSGQGKTAKGIVLGKLLVWQHRQTEVNELTLQVAEMKSRLNDAYTDGQSAMYVARQSKVDELTKQLIDQGQRLNVQTQQIASLKWQLKRLGYTDNGGELMKPPIGDAPKFDLLDELQKRVDDLTRVMEELLEEMKYPTATFEEVICCGINELEQALKGGIK